MSEPLVEIVTTVNSEHDGARIARELIGERLVACVTMRQVRSMYRWAGELCDQKEMELVIKTLASCGDRVERRLRELHSYEVPSILRIPIFRVNDEYASWVERSVQAPPETGVLRLVADAPIPFDEAVRRVRSGLKPLPAEDVKLADAYGRVLAEPVLASDPVPPFAGSMVDGFAVRVADVAAATEDAPVELRVVGEALAGAPPPPAPGTGEALRIMTGAPAPEGTEAIVMLEWTEWRGDRVLVKRPAREGQALRRAGEDLAAGSVALEPGTVLTPAAVGVCASVGRPVLRVHRRPRVAILATGDELLAPDEPLAPGRIRSSNDWTLLGQAREAGALVESVGIARDDEADLRARLGRGAGADVLLTSGGVSVGDRDLVQAVLAELGFEKVFWRVAVSPGKPLLFGRLGSTLVFGLPGNPVSSSVAFENFVRPALRILQGDARPDRPRATARAASTISGPEDRRHFARVRVSAGADGLTVREVGPHGSGNLSSLVRANGLAVVPEGRARIEVGESAEVVLLSDPDPVAAGGG